MPFLELDGTNTVSLLRLSSPGMKLVGIVTFFSTASRKERNAAPNEVIESCLIAT